MKTHKVKDQWVAHIKLLTAVKFCSSTDLHWCFVTQYDLMWYQVVDKKPSTHNSSTNATSMPNPFKCAAVLLFLNGFRCFAHGDRILWPDLVFIEVLEFMRFITLSFTQMNIRCSALSLWHHTWTFYFLRSKIICFKGSVKSTFYDSLLTVTKCVYLQKWVWSILQNVIYILPCICTFFKNICRLKRYASFQNHFFYIS